MSKDLSRRAMLLGSGAALGAVAAGAARVSADEPASAAAAAKGPSGETFRYSLNMGTLLGHKLSPPEEVDVAAKAGYQGIEPWIRNLRRWSEEGGSLPDLRKRIADAGLSVVGAIGFARWIVDDDAVRLQGMEEMRKDMELVAQIGGQWIAAPPAGATGEESLDLGKAAGRYRELLKMGDETGVTPELEIWGPSKTLSRPSEAAFVAMEAAHPKACLLLDVYHIFRGGSDFAGLRLLSGAAMHAFHVNDYPADPPREEMNDSHRVFPGDGIAPYTQLLRTLAESGFRGYLSLELFNRDYWKQDPLTVAKTGLEKTRAVVAKAMG